MSGGMIENGVRILSGGDLGFDFQGFQIEDGNLGGPALADKTDAEVGSYSDAVNPGSVRNITDDRAALGIQHSNMRGACDVNAVIIRIGDDGVPTTAPVKRDFFFDFEFAAVIAG